MTQPLTGDHPEIPCTPPRSRLLWWGLGAAALGTALVLMFGSFLLATTAAFFASASRCLGFATGSPAEGPFALIAELNPAGSGNWQSAVRDGPYWYVDEARDAAGQAVIHRLDGSGREIDRMVLNGGDHARSFAVVDSRIYHPFGDSVRVFDYRPGTTVDRGQTKDTGWRGDFALDPTGRTAVIRNGGRYRAYDFATKKRIGAEINISNAVRQGTGVQGTTLYVLTGATNKPARIDSYSLTTGRPLSSVDVTGVGLEGRHGNREPEGMYGSQFGVKVYTGDKRRLRIYQLAAGAGSSSSTSVGGYSDPVSPAIIGARFGATGSWARYHTGIDYRASTGQPIRAVTAGKVVYAGNSGDWAGNHVAVEHASGYTTMYSHMSRIDVSSGQTVQAGTQLGRVGQTGRSFGPHLHFELYPPGVRPGDVYQAVNPQPWLKKLRGSAGRTPASQQPEQLEAAGGDDAAQLGAALSLPQQGRWSAEQRSIAAAFVTVWRSRQLPDRALEIIMITGLVESEMSSPDEEHSDLDSAGPLQQRRDYGTEEQRRDPVYAAGKFFDRLVTVPNWGTRPQGEVAQAVQISDFPDRYQTRLGDAQNLIASVSNVTPESPQVGSGACTSDLTTTTSPGGDTALTGRRRTVTDPTSGITYEIPIPAGPSGVAMNFALDQLGEPYQFGAQGPDSWDCSGLVSKAWTAAGVDVYPQTEQLVKDLPAVTTPQPGDLLYKPGHVQMFLMNLPSGKQLVVEAPRTGKDVQVVPQWMDVARTLRPSAAG